MGFMDEDMFRPLHDHIIKWLDRNIADVLMVVFDLQVRPRQVETKWEPAVRQTKEGGQFIGFIDFRATVLDFGVKGGLDEVTWRKIGAPESIRESQVVFEAKTEMPPGKLGELFRQVRLYQEGYIEGRPVRRMPFVIVCPDPSEADTLRAQGLHFLKYEPDKVFALGGV